MAKEELIKIFTGSNPTELEKEINNWRNSGKVSVIGFPLLSSATIENKVHITIAFLFVEK